jgi:S1-C subfamily serine protease
MLLWLLAGALPCCAADLVEVVKIVEPAVVQIETDEALGSGVVVDDRGIIVTNFHVIEGAKRANVKFQAKPGTKHEKSFPVKGFLGCEPRWDLTLLKIDPLSEPCAVKIGPEMPAVGEKVAALGNPDGLSFSTTEGIVSAIRTGKQISDSGAFRELFRALGYDLNSTWIQTSTPISHGNSGGPLVNMQAEIVGINTWSDTAGQNVNFAISLIDIKTLLARSLEGETQPLASLPRVHPKRSRSQPRDRQEFTVELPSGRVFSFAAFVVDYPLSAGRTTDPNRGLVVLNYPNNRVFAVANHTGGVLDGTAVAQHDNGVKMVMANYAAGKRQGVLRTWDRSGKPVLGAEYHKGKRHGLSFFVDEGRTWVIQEHDNGTLQWIQLMDDEQPSAGFSSAEEAEKDPTARPLLAKIDEVDAGLKTNEIAFKKRIKDYEQKLRMLRAANLGPQKRSQIQSEIARQNSANEASQSAILHSVYGK